MHVYSIDDEVRKKVYVALGVASFAIPSLWVEALAQCAPGIAWARWPLSFGATFGLLFWAFDKHAWRWSFVRRMHSIPVLDGEWSGEGLSSFKTDEFPDGYRYTMGVKIRQTFSRLEVFTETESSTSRSTMAGFELQRAMVVFRYAFENVPNSRANEELQRHAGLIELHIYGPNEMKGDYFSGKHRLRYGELVLRRRASSQAP